MAEKISGTGIFLVGLYPTSRNPSFDKSDILRRESGLTWTCELQAHFTERIHSRQFQDSIPPSEASAKNFKSRRVSETCLTSDGRRPE